MYIFLFLDKDNYTVLQECQSRLAFLMECKLIENKRIQSMRELHSCLAYMKLLGFFCTKQIIRHLIFGEHNLVEKIISIDKFALHLYEFNLLKIRHHSTSIQKYLIYFRSFHHCFHQRIFRFRVLLLDISHATVSFCFSIFKRVPLII